MLTLESATALLERANRRAGSLALARTLGFDEPLPVAAELGRSLGISELVHGAEIARGPGSLRALLVQTNGAASPRESAAALAMQLARSAPQLLWLIVLRRRGGNEVVLAAWSGERTRPRIAALVVDSRQVLPSDADTLRALSAACAELDLLTHTRWVESLGRESLTRRFYRTLERHVAGLAAGATGVASDADRSTMSVLCISRLLFLSFLQTKGWLDDDPGFLERTFTDRMLEGGGYYRRVLLPLFFGTLNTPPRQRAAAARAFGRVPFLNGGLFARTPVERRCRGLAFDDDTLGSIFSDLLLRYRFTAREENELWTESAIDPEMLGRVFESLMASRDRQASGAFYTPHALVASITRSALLEALSPRPAALPDVERFLDGEQPAPGTARALLTRLQRLTVIDPACGSGAFLVHMLESVATLRQRLGEQCTRDRLRRSVLTTSIFGVDVNPTAVWLCELRLWLSVVIESEECDPMRAPPLPNLDHHIRVGDALAGDGFSEDAVVTGGGAVTSLRQRYSRATGKRKQTLERELERRERSIAVAQARTQLERCAERRRDLIAMLRSRDLFGDRMRPDRSTRDALERERRLARELRQTVGELSSGGALPFSFRSHFPDIASAGGFDLAIGNPPWVRLHRIPPALRTQLRQRFTVMAQPTWERGARGGRVSAGFAAQTDLSALFLERALSLVRAEGSVALLLPAKLWRSLSGGGTRRLLVERARITRMEDWSEAPAAFDAAVYPSLIVARRRGITAGDGEHAERPVCATVHRHHTALAWEMLPEWLALDSDPASPWILAPPQVRTAFDRLTRAGSPLSASPFGSPQLGVKCGCNEAFVVTLLATHGSTATVRSNGSHFQIERELLRPLVRGERVTPWHIEHHAQRIIWTHATDGRPLSSLPPRTMTWLARWRTRLRARSDGRAGAWWSLFRTAAAEDSMPRVVWSDFGRSPRAALVPAGNGIVPLNSCYVVRSESTEDVLALTTLLNSPIAAAWLRLLAEPARGGYSRFLGWTMSLLPLPEPWSRAVALLAPLACRSRSGDPVSDAELVAAVCRAYGVRQSLLDPLLAWTSR